MLSQVFISLLVLNSALCQINGEFWWLHEKVAQLQHVEPPPPKIEDIDEFETDESVKITFEDLHSSEKFDDVKINKLAKNDILPIYFEDHTKLVQINIIKTNITKSNNTIQNQNKTNVLSNTNLKKETTTISNKDEFQFVFPENKHFWKEDVKNDTHYNASKELNLTKESTKIRIHNKIVLSDKIWYEEDNKHSETEAICTFITAHQCILNNGFVHMPGLCPKNTLSDKRICCILPITSSKPRNINLLYNRYKRSNPEDTSTGLKQRNALLQRKYNSHLQQLKLTTTTSRSKPVESIVTPGDYTDPYWNIKNSKFRKPNIPPNDNHDYANPKYGGIPDYSEIYDGELPKPGLVGLYSDNDERMTSWKLKPNKGFYYGGVVEESDENDNGGGFGYATIDPRLGKRKSTVVIPIKRHPQRLMTPATNEDSMENSESHTVHFHSTPDFHVLEGFKLINLAENKNELFRKPTTGNFRESEEEPLIEHTSPIIINSDYYDDILDIEQKIFDNCGKYNIRSVNKNNMREVYDDIYTFTDFKIIILTKELSTESRCDPWLALVVLTKSPHNLLCYATIVHPKAAITAANCVNGKATGEISVRAGVWDLNDRTKSQNRMSSIYIHPQFISDDLANDLAVLHWKRPLRLQSNVLPACIADPHIGDECYFVGWGGYDQALLPRPKWQHATILTPRTCDEKISAPDVVIPDDAFCAKVETRGTVTGVGGPLLCKAGDRISIVGVAVYREDVVILLPTLQWVTSALRDLQIV